jgi:hypothetical protein
MCEQGQIKHVAAASACITMADFQGKTVAHWIDFKQCLDAPCIHGLHDPYVTFPVALVHLSAHQRAICMPACAQEGKGLQGGIERWKSAFLPTYVNGSVFWPIANMINFSFVPATQRIPYINVCGG